jgi:hypothetical protein
MHHAVRPQHPRISGILTSGIRGYLLAKGYAGGFGRACIGFTVEDRAVAARQRGVAGTPPTLRTTGRCGASITDIGGASRQREQTGSGQESKITANGHGRGHLTT